MTAYYNEIEPYCAEWLRNLIAAGHLPAGDVDERPIQEVSADDIKGYDACHFFAGIGGWPYALRLAGWPEDESAPVWTGSCPCQPLSSAGQRRGHADERHLWPAFHALIAERRPATVFGEQVASKLGREWLAGVRADLEHVGYAVGAADLPAAGVGAPHIRQRLFWVGHAAVPRRGEQPGRPGQAGGGPTPQSGRSGNAVGLADAGRRRPQRAGQELDQTPAEAEGAAHQRQRLWADAGHGGAVGGMANSFGARLEGRQVEPARQERAPAERGGRTGRMGDADGAGPQPGRQAAAAARHGHPVAADGGGFWDAFDLIGCADGKARRTESGIHPLAYGISARVGRLRAYGNAIVPQVAAAFVSAYLREAA